MRSSLGGPPSYLNKAELGGEFEIQGSEVCLVLRYVQAIDAFSFLPLVLTLIGFDLLQSEYAGNDLILDMLCHSDGLPEVPVRMPTAQSELTCEDAISPWNSGINAVANKLWSSSVRNTTGKF